MAGFCRNCLAKWYRDEAELHGISLDYDQAREHIYGMSHTDWKDRYQVAAGAEQKQAFESTRSAHADTRGGN
ncbi:DUF1244 domain-containing protein [Salinisphaera sp. LB1]|uniref:DUF1244 domain-containing protein n=1 Tax=Salinisphaera sp. LB1 TaxID=2183911 RepID=UPI000D7DCBA3|nr:DUF1244 domain-containing protein [Salinisphaera sp. LB1]AWN17938.1 protein of unknown function DUF1244 [Salinisphaera sp. LB1]